MKERTHKKRSDMERICGLRYLEYLGLPQLWRVPVSMKIRTGALYGGHITSLSTVTSSITYQLSLSGIASLDSMRFIHRSHYAVKVA